MGKLGKIKQKKNPDYQPSGYASSHKRLNKIKILECDYLVEFLSELVISIHHPFCGLNGITSKSAIFATFHGKTN